MKNDFLNIADHNELANYFDLTYLELSRVIYPRNDAYKYHQFEIPKKAGGTRNIASPAKKLKLIQIRLKDALYEIYPIKPSAHGFIKKKSIVSNARMHLGKKYIFNLDLANFFGTIHFGRIRNLFRSHPFDFNHSVSTILAHICCFENSLPQGAPTSPILSNMIALKLDSQLQSLAKETNSTYTRYADDISFSFTSNKYRLPEKIIILQNEGISPGSEVKRIIEDNGFEINYNKIRLCSTFSRMEVTGLTVNEFPNVRRQYIRQISSMLHAWRKYGYELAQQEFNLKYDKKERASGKPKSYLHMVKGKLAFLRSVRTGQDPLFNKLAIQFNDLVMDSEHKFNIYRPSNPEQKIIDSLWIVEAYGDDGNDAHYQGSAFDLKDVGIITCAHVISKDRSICKKLQVYKHSKYGSNYTLKVDRICFHRDIAICSIENKEGQILPAFFAEGSNRSLKVQDKIKLIGFPGYNPGQNSPYIADAKVTRTYSDRAVKKFDIDALVRKGNSGGPVIDEEAKVIGIAQKGTVEGSGNNECLIFSEIDAVLKSDGCRIDRK